MFVCVQIQSVLENAKAWCKDLVVGMLDHHQLGTLDDSWLRTVSEFRIHGRASHVVDTKAALPVCIHGERDNCMLGGTPAMGCFPVSRSEKAGL